MEGFRHYITTRFNVGLYGAEKRIDMDRDEWMQHRIGLFTTFALPSLMAQSCQNFPDRQANARAVQAGT